MNSFISLYNQFGIACASDADNTIYRLSKAEPVAVAVPPLSPIPWEEIITQYLSTGEPIHHKTLEEYAKDFEKFFQSIPTDIAWNKLEKEERKLVFLGFGEDEIYPSVFNTQIEIEEEASQMKLGPSQTNQINIYNSAAFCCMGYWDCLAPILYGSTKQINDFVISKQSEIYETYKQKVINRFKGTKYEEYVVHSFENYNSEVKRPYQIVEEATSDITKDVKKGIDSFSIEDMVTSVENLVNANVRLTHLKNGGKGLVGQAREIAVLTKTEGFTWIKHSLFAI